MNPDDIKAQAEMIKRGLRQLNEVFMDLWDAIADMPDWLWLQAFEILEAEMKKARANFLSECFADRLSQAVD
jgi:hypothetical protein